MDRASGAGRMRIENGQAQAGAAGRRIVKPGESEHLKLRSVEAKVRANIRHLRHEFKSGRLTTTGPYIYTPHRAGKAADLASEGSEHGATCGQSRFGGCLGD